MFYLPLQLRALLRAALEFVARQGHLERCPNTDAHHRLFSHLSRPAGTIRAAARRCGVTLPSASGDLTGTWQIRLSWDGLGGSLHHDGRRLLSGRRLTCEAEVAAAPDTAVVTALHHDEADRTGWRWSLLEPKPLAVPLLVFSHVLRPRHGVLSGWPSPTRWVADELVRRHLAVRVPADGAGREGPGVVVHPDILFALRLSDRAAPSRPDDLGCDQIPDELLAPMGSGAGLAPAPSLCARAFESPQRPVSVLGQAVRPFPGETSESYGRRLSEVNGLRARELRRRAGMAEHHRDWSADLFAAVTGMPADVFTRAMPEVRAVQMTEDPGVEDSDRLPLALYHRRRACVRCAADHGAINDITILTSDDHSVCHRHEVWIGEMPDERGMQVDVSGLPAVIAASAEHRDLTARYGPVVTDQSFRTVGKIIRHWLARGIGPFVWFDRLDQLTDSVNGVLGHRDPLMPIVTYPEKVKITAMVVPSERARFHGADLAAVKAELCSRTSCPDLKLIAAGDPLLAVLRGQIGVDSPFRQNPR